jgi:hypothetical protein
LAARWFALLSPLANWGFDSWRGRDKVEKVVKLVSGEGFYCPDNEFSVDVAFAFEHPVNLAYRYLHRLGELR